MFIVGPPVAVVSLLTGGVIGGPWWRRPRPLRPWAGPSLRGDASSLLCAVLMGASPAEGFDCRAEREDAALTGLCAVFPSRTVLSAIGMDHVLTSIAWGPIKTTDQVPAEIVQIGIEDGSNLRPLFVVAKNLAVANYSDNFAGIRIDDIAVEHVFLFCVSDVTSTTPNPARCSASHLIVCGCREMPR